MSNLLSKASIVLTPTAYSDGTLHSIKPLQTLGSELVTNGNFATDSDFTKTEQSASTTTITSGKANFNIVSGAYAKLTQSISYTSERVYKLTAIVNGTNGNKMRFRDDVGNSGGLTTSNGQITMDGTDQSVEIIFTTNSNSDEIAIERQDQSGDYSFTVDNLSITEVIDADFDFSRPTTGSATGIGSRENSSGNIESVAANLPRIDYLGGTGHILLEPQTTNLLDYSEDFTQWSIGSDATIQSGFSAPDGTNNAYKVTKTGISQPYLYLGASLTTSTTRSIFAKTVSGTGTVNLLSHNSNTNNLFTLTENWQRFEVSSSNSTGVGNFYAVDFRGSSSLSEIIVFGANATNDQTFATSYIPTSGSTVTRSADICNNSGSSDLINSTEGVLYAEIAALVDDQTRRDISISDGSGQNTIRFHYQSGVSNKIRLQIKSSNTTTASQVFSVTDIKDFHKIAISYKLNDVKFFIDGVEKGTDTSAAMPTGLNELAFTQGGSTNNFFGKVKCVAVFKEALTDEELTCLTT